MIYLILALFVCVVSSTLSVNVIFNNNYYFTNNPDVAAHPWYNTLAACGNHYITYGMYEGRRPSLMFDPVYYCANNPDVACVGNAYLGYVHFMNYGYYEGRRGSADFSVGCYLRNNQDVADYCRIVSPTQKTFIACGFKHFDDYGWNERFRDGTYLSLEDGEECSNPLRQPYITDITVVGGGHPTQAICPAGYSRIHWDLNAGSGGQYIYFCVQREVGQPPLTDLKIVGSGNALSSCGTSYGGAWKFVNYDLNAGAGGQYIYLCTASAGGKPGKPMADFDVQYHYTGQCYNYDLNAGAGGEWIYACPEYDTTPDIGRMEVKNINYHFDRMIRTSSTLKTLNDLFVDALFTSTDQEVLTQETSQSVHESSNWNHEESLEVGVETSVSVSSGIPDIAECEVSFSVSVTTGTTDSVGGERGWETSVTAPSQACRAAPGSLTECTILYAEGTIELPYTADLFYYTVGEELIHSMTEYAASGVYSGLAHSETKMFTESYTTISDFNTYYKIFTITWDNGQQVRHYLTSNSQGDYITTETTYSGSNNQKWRFKISSAARDRTNIAWMTLQDGENYYASIGSSNTVDLETAYYADGEEKQWWLVLKLDGLDFFTIRSHEGLKYMSMDILANRASTVDGTGPFGFEEFYIGGCVNQFSKDLIVFVFFFISPNCSTVVDDRYFLKTVVVFSSNKL